MIPSQVNVQLSSDLNSVITFHAIRNNNNIFDTHFSDSNNAWAGPWPRVGSWRLAVLGRVGLCRAGSSRRIVPGRAG